MSGKYDDMIGLPHHRSKKHPHMTMAERAAQFSPFAALTGYGAVIAETGTLTTTPATVAYTNVRKTYDLTLEKKLVSEAAADATAAFRSSSRSSAKA